MAFYTYIYAPKQNQLNLRPESEPEPESEIIEINNGKEMIVQISKTEVWLCKN